MTQEYVSLSDQETAQYMARLDTLTKEIADSTIDVKAIRELDDALSAQWEAEGFAKPTLSASAVTAEGALVKLAGNEVNTEDMLDTAPHNKPDLMVRVFIGGEQRDILIPSQFREQDQGMIDPVSNITLFDTSDEFVRSMKSRIEEFQLYDDIDDVPVEERTRDFDFTPSEDLQWLETHLGKQIVIAAQDSTIINRESGYTPIAASITRLS